MATMSNDQIIEAMDLFGLENHFHQPVALPVDRLHLLLNAFRSCSASGVVDLRTVLLGRVLAFPGTGTIRAARPTASLETFEEDATDLATQIGAQFLQQFLLLLIEFQFSLNLWYCHEGRQAVAGSASAESSPWRSAETLSLEDGSPREDCYQCRGR